MSLRNSLYEHLKTRKKYNTLLIKYETLKDSLEEKITECNLLKRQMIIKDNTWESRIIELEKKLSKKVGGKNVRKPKTSSVKLSRTKQNDNK